MITAEERILEEVVSNSPCCIIADLSSQLSAMLLARPGLFLSSNVPASSTHAPTLCSFWFPISTFCLLHWLNPALSFMGLNIAFLGVLSSLGMSFLSSSLFPVPCIFPSKCSCRRGNFLGLPLGVSDHVCN